jgi:hypothetical protein
MDARVFARARRRERSNHSHQISSVPATRSSRPGCAHDPCPRLSMERSREAERRQALHLKLCVRRDAARIEASMRPPPGAPPRRFWVVGPRLRACADRAANLLQRCSSRPGRSARRAEPQNPRESGGRTRTRRRRIRRPDFPEAPAAGFFRAGPPRGGALPQPARSAARRHRSTSLDERDRRILREVFGPGISFFGANGRHG